MKLSSFERALGAMGTMERGKPYALDAGDAKRKLVVELQDVCKEAGVSPLLIGGLAVNHFGYARFTADVDLLLTREEAGRLHSVLRNRPGWKRYAEGFKNTHWDVGLDFCVEGERTSPGNAEVFPSPRDLGMVRVRPLPVVSLAGLIALKVMSGRAKDEADVVELLKLHFRRLRSLRRGAARLLSTEEARRNLDALVARARDERARRR